VSNSSEAGAQQEPRPKGHGMLAVLLGLEEKQKLILSGKCTSEMCRLGYEDFLSFPGVSILNV
jgi:hypothetical protein